MTILDTSKSVLIPNEPGRQSGVSAATVPGSKISMQILTIAPGEEAVPGNDLETETAGYVVRGRSLIRA